MKYKKSWIYLFLMFAIFYLLPFFIKDTGSGMLILLFVFPCICFIGSVLYGRNADNRLLFPIAVCILFLPTVWLFYNDSALIYTVIYGGISLLGVYMGSFIRKCDGKKKGA